MNYVIIKKAFQFFYKIRIIFYLIMLILAQALHKLSVFLGIILP